MNLVISHITIYFKCINSIITEYITVSTCLLPLHKIIKSYFKLSGREQVWMKTIIGIK